MKKITLTVLSLAVSVLAQHSTFDSGGPLMVEQAAYDVVFYDLALSIDPATRSIAGYNIVHADILDTLSFFVLDFDERFEIDSVVVIDSDGSGTPAFERRSDSRIWISLPATQRPGDRIRVKIAYHGIPVLSTHPPWDEGFVWDSAERLPWDGVACQLAGADIWWPCKDHPSDEPDSMALSFTVPDDVRCVSNGKLMNIVSNNDKTDTYNWFVSTPINNYGVTFYLAPYERIESTYTSVTGDSFPVIFWSLPRNLERHRAFFPQILQQMAFMEQTYGPYPFRADKYGVVEAPYLGMEHQSAIAYGNEAGSAGYGYNAGYDALHLHEFAHEWWGNMITVSDWKDFWIHEGFATYTEALYTEHLRGLNEYHKNVDYFRQQLDNRQPIAPTESRTVLEMYNGDIYYKGACILHTLRYLVGKDVFFDILREMLYPDSSAFYSTDGAQCRFVDTQDFTDVAESVSGMELDWFFEAYLRYAELPVLIADFAEDDLFLQWQVDSPLGFYLPVEISIHGKSERIDMSAGYAAVPLKQFQTPLIDPDHWLLMDYRKTADLVAQPSGIIREFALYQNYPNPFNNSTVIRFSLARRCDARLDIYNVNGELIATLVSGVLEAGSYEKKWKTDSFASGTYFYRLETPEFVDKKKLIVLK